ncbi:hypothetical protein [uncultured Helicobacter sp.]|uniref:hypothetical protein n=1 Tax=uncultured Helicobacter sp. TaxID=175537 RepID=UPI00374F0F4C
MAVSLVGNITYINQNSQTSAVQHAAAQARPDVLLEANKGEFERKLQEIAHTNPAQPSPKVDKDGSNGSNSAQQGFEKDSKDSKQKQGAQTPAQGNKEEYKEYYDGLLNISV